MAVEADDISALLSESKGTDDGISELFCDLSVLSSNSAAAYLDSSKNLSETDTWTDLDSVYSDDKWKSFTDALLNTLDDTHEESKDTDVEMDEKHEEEVSIDNMNRESEVVSIIVRANRKDEDDAESERTKPDMSETQEGIKNHNTIFRVWDIRTSLVNEYDDSDLIKQLKTVLIGNNQGPSTSLDDLKVVPATGNIDELIASLDDLSLDHFDKERLVINFRTANACLDISLFSSFV